MDLTDEPQPQPTLESPPDAPYVVTRVAPWVRLIKMVAPWVLPLGLSILMWQTAGPDESWSKLIWLPALTFLWAAWYVQKAYATTEIRALHTIRKRIKPTGVLRKIGYATVLLFVACLLIGYSYRDSPGGAPNSTFVWTIFAYVGYLVMLFMPQYSETYSQAAKAEFVKQKHQEAAEQIQQDSLRRLQQQKRTRFDDVFKNLWDQWYVRYSVGALMMWFAIDMWATSAKGAWEMPLLIGLCGIGCMKELALWLVGLVLCGGLAYAAIGALAAIPVGAAIIIGALIIANSRSR